MDMVLASKNPHKLQELSAMLKQYGIHLILQSELGIDVDVEETGKTFEENSQLKAEAVCQASGLPALADDSGLMVDALSGAPGVYSARYGGELCHSDKDRYEHLLSEMEQVPDDRRTARFVCVLTCVKPDGQVIAARGTCEGTILRAPQGEDSFGYDPVFYVPEERKTFAQMSGGRKNEISHRANALKAFCAKLK